MYPGSFDEDEYQSEEFQELRSRIEKAGMDLEVMKDNNPQRILRNYLVEEAIKEYEDRRSLHKINSLLTALSSPYESDEELSEYQQPPSKEYDNNYSTHCNT
jgi:uncharacterized protein YdiU (UPF0061 family)